VRVVVLFAVRREYRRALDDRAVVDPALGHRISPHGLAGLRFQRVLRAVRAAYEDQPRAIDRGGDGRRIDRVVRPASRLADPDRFSRPFIEGVKPMGAWTVVAPTFRNRADDDEIAFDDRGSGASAVRRPGAVFIGQRTVPHQFTVV